MWVTTAEVVSPLKVLDVLTFMSLKRPLSWKRERYKFLNWDPEKQSQFLGKKSPWMRLNKVTQRNQTSKNRPFS